MEEQRKEEIEKIKEASDIIGAKYLTRFAKRLEVLKKEGYSDEEIENIFLDELDDIPINNGIKKFYRNLYQLKIKELLGQSYLDKVNEEITDDERLKIKKGFLEELLFDKVNICGIDYRYLSWSGIFLQAIDLSEIDFDGVILNLDELSKLSGKNITNYEGNKDITLVNTNANIKLNSGKIHIIEYKKEVVENSGISKFLYGKDKASISTITDTIDVRPKNCDFSSTLIKEEIDYKDIDLESNKYTNTGIVIVLPENNKWSMTERNSLIKNIKDGSLVGAFLKGVDGEIYEIESKEEIAKKQKRTEYYNSGAATKVIKRFKNDN